jgi:hypothetical protein
LWLLLWKSALRACAPILTPSPPQAVLAIQLVILMQTLLSNFVSEPAG